MSGDCAMCKAGGPALWLVTLSPASPALRQTYFSHYKGYYFTGDGARRDEDG